MLYLLSALLISFSRRKSLFVLLVMNVPLGDLKQVTERRMQAPSFRYGVCHLN